MTHQLNIIQEISTRVSDLEKAIYTISEKIQRVNSLLENTGNNKKHWLNVGETVYYFEQCPQQEQLQTLSALKLRGDKIREICYDRQTFTVINQGQIIPFHFDYDYYKTKEEAVHALLEHLKTL